MSVNWLGLNGLSIHQTFPTCPRVYALGFSTELLCHINFPFTCSQRIPLATVFWILCFPNFHLPTLDLWDLHAQLSFISPFHDSPVPGNFDKNILIKFDHSYVCFSVRKYLIFPVGKWHKQKLNIWKTRMYYMFFIHYMCVQCLWLL